MKMSQLPGWAGRAGTWLLDLLFPMKCPFCQHILEDSRAPACPGCQKMLPWLSGREAERPVEFTSGCLSPLAYRDRVPDSIHRYKFPGTPSYAGAYGLLTAQCVRDNRAAPLDLVTWIPLSPKRRRKRGFDQAEALARAGTGPPRPRDPGKVPEQRSPVPPPRGIGTPGQRTRGLPPERERGPRRAACPSGGRCGHLRCHPQRVRPAPALCRGRRGALRHSGPGPQELILNFLFFP